MMRSMLCVDTIIILPENSLIYDMTSATSATATKSRAATRRITSFRQRFGEAHFYLACHAAFPLALTPDLLYRLWATFQRDIHGEVLNIPWIAVADLLLSSLCKEVGYELYEMEATLRNLLLSELKANVNFGIERINELSDFVLAYVSSQIDSPDIDIRDFAQAQRWTALAYTQPAAAANELALNLSKLKLEDKPEWIRMATLAEAFAEPLIEAQFEPLLVYLQGMRNFARGDRLQAKSTFETLSGQEKQVEIAGVTLPIPELTQRQPRIDFIRVPVPPLEVFQFEIAQMVRQPRLLNLGSKWQVNLSRAQAEFFLEDLGEKVVLRMVSIPGGKFMMGAPEGEGDYRERPRHSVRIAPFFISKYPITQAQWSRVAQLAKVRIDLNVDPSRFKGKHLPVEQVTWYEAMEFCERLQQQTGKPYRLRSEAEWEYACRARTNTPFHFGEIITPKLANYDGKNLNHTSEVGSFRVANAFGLYDMHGNVWEWCADYWRDDYTLAPIDGNAWIAEDDNQYRVLRGGSWINQANYCRCAYRNGVPPNNTILSIGFRVAVSFGIK